MVQKNIMFIENGSDKALSVSIEYIAYHVSLKPGEDLKIEVEAPSEVNLLSLFDVKYLSTSIVVYVNNNTNMFEKYKICLFENGALSFTTSL